LSFKWKELESLESLSLIYKKLVHGFKDKVWYENVISFAVVQ